MKEQIEMTEIALTHPHQPLAVAHENGDLEMFSAFTAKMTNINHARPISSS